MSVGLAKTSGAYNSSTDAPIEDLRGGIRRQMMGFGETIMTCRIWFETNAAGRVHCDPHAQTTYIESGRFHYRVGDDNWEIGAGDCIFIAPNTDHGMICVETGSVIDSFSPMRADFLSQGEV